MPSASSQARQAARDLIITGERHDDNDGWMLSYLDLLTLLLVLFVLLLAMQGAIISDDGTPTVDIPEVSAPASAVMVSPMVLAAVTQRAPVQAVPVDARGVMVRLAAGPDPTPRWQMVPATPVKSVSKRAIPQVNVEAALAVTSAPAQADQNDADTSPMAEMNNRLAGIEGVQVTRERERTILRIEDRLLFPSADVTIGDQGSQLLDRLLPALKAFDGEISVEGHTDSRTISTAQFPSNWELSVGRATAVLRYLSRNGVTPGQLRAIGYGPTRPLAGNDSEAGRAENRRVELVLSPVAADQRRQEVDRQQ